MAKVIVTMPHGGNSISMGAAQGFYVWPTRGKHQTYQLTCSMSAALHTFNSVWAQALNIRKSGFTHFAMIHSDITPDKGWLDTLMAEMERLEADIVSAVVPIKSDEGVTSTAVDSGDLWKPKRLTMTEVMNLPETFSADDVGGPLLVNNGLWVCDFRKSWVETFQFEILNRIMTNEAGIHYAQLIPEDWLASRRWNDLGLKVCATRKVGLAHEGSKSYSNRFAWGTWEHDETLCETKSK